MSKELMTLIEKAENNGYATKNGRMSGWGGEVSKLQEKWYIILDDNVVELYHWGTRTLVIDRTTNSVRALYGQSNSDRDSVNQLLSYFNVPNHVHYYPSTGNFELHDDKTDEVIAVD